jgi:hypothetical protein
MVADICLGLAAFAYRAFKDGGLSGDRDMRPISVLPPIA